MSQICGTEGEFGYEWKIYSEIIPLHEKQFEGWITPVPLAYFRGKSFLDAGCGIGRNSLWALKSGAASGLAFDFDKGTVGVAKKNLAQYDNCDVKFMSIYDLCEKDRFDVVFCTGVLHHLADPKLAVHNLIQSVKPGGIVILWVYAFEGNEKYLSFIDPIRRYLTSKIHPSATRILSKFLTCLLKFYLLFPHKNEYMHLLKERSFRHTEAMVFDQLLPSISHYFKKEEVVELVEDEPVKVRHLTHTHGISWTLVAERVK